MGGEYCIRYEFPYLFILRIISFYRIQSNEPTLRGILIFPASLQIADGISSAIPDGRPLIGIEICIE